MDYRSLMTLVDFPLIFTCLLKSFHYGKGEAGNIHNNNWFAEMICCLHVFVALKQNKFNESSFTYVSLSTLVKQNEPTERFSTSFSMSFVIKINDIFTILTSSNIRPFFSLRLIYKYLFFITVIIQWSICI